jgi:hypothetical protein
MGDAFRQDFVDIYEFLTFIELIFANEFARATGVALESPALSDRVKAFRESIAQRFPTRTQSISTLRRAIAVANSQLLSEPPAEREKQLRALFERELRAVLGGGDAGT